ncbi:unnamed protein product [Rotaria sp. Silwood2]|nr:unnamed protein product [Rotaria sp. Silwood2]CAF3195506.1 unnamed protein product [Rotaria sp. Silwood2]CAF3974062.1 unnamed protein product [Rotaria sp. Silwood2]CAF4221802.1 unnamed protein product [Rotaria sp. Silwood2]CAF4490680.1 unnamed protein product [Rotaria sp. Silwood2]
MAAVNTSILVLLDPTDQHRQFDGNYDAQLFSRFTNKNRCILHVLSRLAHVHLLHFFIPNAENTLIRARVTLFKNTIFYIYCIDEASVKTMERTYNYPMFVKIFHVQWLSTYVCQAAIAHLVERAERAQHEPEEYDTSLQAAAELANTLANELNEYMIVKTGAQPDDRV